MGSSMEKGKIYIFTGDGHGKSPAALGCALQSAARGEHVVIIQFLKGKGLDDSDFVRRLEPEIKLFRFEKSDGDFEHLSESEKKEAVMNIKNGMSYARKVLMTGECNLLILDEVLGLIDNHIITEDELKSLITCKQDETTLILTGISMRDEICAMADEVSRIQTVHFKSWDGFSEKKQ